MDVTVQDLYAIIGDKEVQLITQRTLLNKSAEVIKSQQARIKELEAPKKD